MAESDWGAWAESPGLQPGGRGFAVRGSVLMAVVGVTRMGVGVLVLVLVMGIGVALEGAWIVAMAMAMAVGMGMGMGLVQRLMAMQVTVLLTQQQRDAGRHQPRGQEQVR